MSFEDRPSMTCAPRLSRGRRHKWHKTREKTDRTPTRPWPHPHRPPSGRGDLGRMRREVSLPKVWEEFTSGKKKHVFSVSGTEGEEAFESTRRREEKL